MDEVKIVKDFHKSKTAKNAKEYEKIAKQRQHTEKFGEKELIHNRVQYENGVVKNKLVGIRKAGKVIFDIGIKN